MRAAQQAPPTPPLAGLAPLLCELERVHGVDLQDYSPTHVSRRLERWLAQHGLAQPQQALSLWAQDAALLGDFVHQVHVGVTAFFRDPSVFALVRRAVLPLLATYMRPQIWHAGCATGEEAYSLAICLHELGLLPRCRIYASDLNERALAQAHSRRYGFASLREGSRNYALAAGQAPFADFYRVQEGAGQLDAALRDRVLFVAHNLVRDAAFAEVQLLMCRNVLIYFNPRLRARCLRLFDHSLCVGGVLVLGLDESLACSDIGTRYQELAPQSRVYRKLADG